VSLEVQRAKLTAYAQAMDLDLVEVFADEGASAKNLKRPGIQAALRAMHEGAADGLLVCKLDRLTRSLMDLHKLLASHFGEKAGKSLISLGESIDTRSASGRMLINLLMTVAEWEREIIGERTRDALQFRKRQGVQLGRPAYGWTRSTLVDPATERLIVERRQDEDAIAAEIRAARAAGETYQAIADRLTARHVPTKRGGQWSNKVVRSIALRAC
jgi:DNA invertase Pin-like site-specific DNA recombinase